MSELYKEMCPESWLKKQVETVVPEDELENLIKQDSWTFGEGTSYLCRKPYLEELEKPTKRYMIDIWLKLPDEERELLKEDVDSMLMLLDRIYKEALRAYHAGKLKAKEETKIVKGKSFIIYHVRPFTFLKWAYEKKFIFDAVIQRLINKHIFKKKGRKLDEENISLLTLMLALSKKTENKEKNAREVIESLKGEEFLDAYCKRKKLTEEQKENKKSNLLPKLRKHPEFGGLRKTYKTKKQ